MALGPTRGPRPETLCRKMQRTASATAELLHRPRLLATENCSVGDSRTVAPAAVYGVVYDAALGPTRPSARLGATRATVELLHRSRIYGKKCNVGNSRTVAPVAYICCDTALGPKRYAGKYFGAVGPTAEVRTTPPRRGAARGGRRTRRASGIGSARTGGRCELITTRPSGIDIKSKVHCGSRAAQCTSRWDPPAKPTAGSPHRRVH